MELRLSNSDGVPVYRQIVNQLKWMIASGRLRPGQELPTIRSLAERLVINHNTVVHAYAELEKEGVIECRHGCGSFVAESGTKPAGKQAAQALTAKVDSLLTDAAHLKLELPDLLKLIMERQTALTRTRKEDVDL